MNHTLRFSFLLLVSLGLIACGGESQNKTESSKSKKFEKPFIKKPPVNKPPVETESIIKSIRLIARHQEGSFEESAAEVIDYHKASKRAFVVNAEENKITVLDLSDLPKKTIKGKKAFVLNNLKSKATSIDVGKKLKPENGKEFKVGAINSLSIVGNLMAVAIENKKAQKSGAILFYRLDSNGSATKLHAVKAGAMPDMVKITPDGKYALSADEGEPSGDYKNDPEGTVTLVKIDSGTPEKTSRQLNFHEVNIPDEVIIKASIKESAANPSAELSKDLEPEYVAVSEDSKIAWVSLQENNALAIIDLTVNEPKIDKVVSLGFKDHGQEVNKLDGNKDDNKGKLSTHEGLYGIYMPDTIVSYTLNGKHYVLSANEGDSRKYRYREKSKKGEKKKKKKTSYINEVKIKDLKKPLADSIKHLKKPLKNLKVHSELGLSADDKYEKLYAFGARSFSIWDENGSQVYDSGSILEQEILKATPKFFNTNHKRLKLDNRSDDKGPEPEAIEVAKIKGKYIAFVGLERQGGFMVFDVSDTSDVKFISFINNRNFKAKLKKKGGYKNPSKAGDLGPESIKFVAAKDSAIGKPLLIVANEVSGSTSVYKINLK